MAAFTVVNPAKRRMRLADGTVVLVDANSVPSPQGGVLKFPEPGKQASSLGAIPPANDPTAPITAPLSASSQSATAPTAPTDIRGALSALGSLAQNSNQNVPRPALPPAEGNDFLDRANDIPVLGNVVSGVRGALQAASQPNAKLGNILSYGALNTLFPNDLRASEQRQQLTADQAQEQARADANRKFQLEALKALAEGGNAADKNANEAIQNENTARYQQGELGINKQKVGLEGQRLGIEGAGLGLRRQELGQRSENANAIRQQKDDEGFNTSLSRYGSIGKTYDPLKQMLVDIPGQKPLDFNEVLERSAFDNPRATQSKNWALQRLEGFAAGKRAWKGKPEDFDKQFGGKIKKIKSTFFPDAQ